MLRSLHVCLGFTVVTRQENSSNDKEKAKTSPIQGLCTHTHVHRHYKQLLLFAKISRASNFAISTSARVMRKNERISRSQNWRE